MKRVQVGSLVFILAFSPLASGQTKNKSSAGVEEELKKLDHAWLDAEKRDDVPFCEKLFADSYVLVMPSGQMFNKEQRLGVLRSSDRPTFEVLDPDDIKVHLFGNVAILTDHTMIKGSDSKGTRIDGEYRVFRVMIKQDGKWRATGAVMTKLQ